MGITRSLPNLLARMASVWSVQSMSCLVRWRASEIRRPHPYKSRKSAGRTTGSVDWRWGLRRSASANSRVSSWTVKMGGDESVVPGWCQRFRNVRRLPDGVEIQPEVAQDADTLPVRLGSFEGSRHQPPVDHVLRERAMFAGLRERPSVKLREDAGLGSVWESQRLFEGHKRGQWLREGTPKVAHGSMPPLHPARTGGTSKANRRSCVRSMVK
jgi:hypothetical protein